MSNFSGKELYELYRQSNLRNDVEVESWYDLDEVDQAIWNDFADRLIQTGNFNHALLT